MDPQAGEALSQSKWHVDTVVVRGYVDSTGVPHATAWRHETRDASVALGGAVLMALVLGVALLLWQRKEHRAFSESMDRYRSRRK